MFVFNFKKQFSASVESGLKRQTIRAERKDKKRPHPGDVLRHYTGLRTTSCRKLMDTICTDCLQLYIYRDDPEVVIVVDGRKLTLDEGVELAKLDGFNTRAELLGFFEETHGLPFSGFLAKW